MNRIHVILALIVGASAQGCSGGSDPGDAGVPGDSRPEAGAALDAEAGSPDTNDTGTNDNDANDTDAGAADADRPDGDSLDAGATDANDPDAGDLDPRCATSLGALPEDTAARGPWPVGVRTATAAVPGLRLEVWYPAAPGSEAGVAPERYDLRDALPASERAKIPDADNPWQACDCRRGLPVDPAAGVRPVVVFVHGTAGFRTQSLEHALHWASRGFVVIAADHPGLWMRDLLGIACGQGVVRRDLAGDLGRIVAALRAPAADLGFLAGRVDPGRIGMVGHSAGGQAIAEQGAVASVLVPLAAGGTRPGAALRSTLVMAGTADAVVPLDRTVAGFEASPRPRRLATLRGAGHLAFSSLCSLRNARGEDLLTVARRVDVCGAALAGGLFDCDPSRLPDPEGWAIVHDLTAAALEETLLCRASAGARFAGAAARHPALDPVREER